ncbi:MAG TPA: L-seryl-tRNA(Sec) selenium transferase [Gemmatimonadales bacterium]|nr:L-seryl-tRNA(Sec) selenium transferase [Gemmatimonadales bacterium]
MTDARRSLPSVARLLDEPGVQELLTRTPRNLVVAAARETLAAVRDGRAPPPEDWGVEIAERVAQRAVPSLHPVLNATGVVLHTNLGRAPLAAAAITAVQAIATGYSTLELDSATGTRGNRGDHCAELLAGLAGTEAALVVNNAAGALLLALNALAEGKEVLISRGELIEIGGSFRIPDILEKSGARLREVGTTNRTHLEDYRRALSPETGALLTVHRSNFAQSGFVATPAPAELAALAHQADIPYLHDVGSGLLADLSHFGLSDEPRVTDAVRWGADLVLFSGDKLLGGPQAGCLVGRRSLVALARQNPLARALRADKLTLAALEATLALYHDPETALREIPVLRMLTLPPEALRERAEQLRTAITSSRTAAPPHCRTAAGSSAVGGGSFPGAELPTTLVVIAPGPRGAASLALRLRLGSPPVIARVQNEELVLDPRTLPLEALEQVGAAVVQALEED